MDEKNHEKISLVELAIFTAITLVFLNSLYNLFFSTLPNPNDIEKKRITDLASVPTENKQTESYERTVELSCSDSVQEIKAKRIRLAGNYCPKTVKGKEDRSIASFTSQEIRSAKIMNHTTNVSATIFNDPELNRFTTDYIQLAEGKNAISIEFAYKNGSVYTQSFNAYGVK